MRMSDEMTRNTTVAFGDDTDEMTERTRLDDRTMDALFSGRIPVGQEDHTDVAAFAQRLRAATTEAPQPVPTAALSAVLADGISTDSSGRPVAVGHDVPAPVMAVSERPRRRRTKRMLEVLVTKLAGISLIAKTSVAAAALTAGATGAGLTGNLPDTAQGAFDRAFSTPTAQNVETVEVEAEIVREQADVAPVQPIPVEPSVPEQAERPDVPGAEGRQTAAENAGENGEHGRATAEEAARDGRAFGQRQAEEAQERREDTPAGDQQTGEAASSEGRETASEASGGRSQTGGDASSDRSDNADPAGGPDETPAEGNGPPEETPRGRP
jgi:hypothetical protein